MVCCLISNTCTLGSLLFTSFIESLRLNHWDEEVIFLLKYTPSLVPTSTFLPSVFSIIEQYTDRFLPSRPRSCLVQPLIGLTVVRISGTLLYITSPVVLDGVAVGLLAVLRVTNTLL